MENLIDLDAAVKPDRLKRVLHFFWKRAGKRETIYLYKMASMALMITRHWAKLPKADIEALEQIKQRTKPNQAGMTSRNMSTLRQFDDPIRLQALLNLPQELIKRARTFGNTSMYAAQLMQTAVAVELLLHGPLRLRNLRELRIGTHLKTQSRDRIVIAISSDEVKNGVASNAALTNEVAKLVGLYQDRYRPLLDPHGTDWLFPGKKPGRPSAPCG